MSHTPAIRPALSAIPALNASVAGFCPVFDPSDATESIEFAVGLADRELALTAHERLARVKANANESLIKPVRSTDADLLDEEYRVSGDAAAAASQKIASDDALFFPEDSSAA